MSEDFTIRHAGRADREFVLALASRFAEFELPPWRSREDVRDGTARRLDAALHSIDDRSLILVAETAGGERAGFAWLLLVEDFYTGRDVAKVSEIAVVRDGTGAGRALMRAAEAWARERGCTLVELNVMERNARARAFYQRCGFAPEYTMMVKKLE